TVTTTNTYYNFTSLTPNTNYTFQVKTRDNYSQDSIFFSDSEASYTNPAIPLAVSATVNGQTSANLTWNANNNPNTTVYQIYTGTILKGSTTSTFHTITGLVSGTDYTFTVRAIYNLDNSSYVVSESSNAITTEIPAKDVTLELKPDSSVISFQFINVPETHTVEVTNIVDYSGTLKASLILHSNTVIVTLGAGESENVDLDNNSVNDTTVTVSSVTSDQANFTLTAIPQGTSGVMTTIPKVINSTEKAVSINNNAKTTVIPLVKLNFNLTNTTLMAVSNEPNFENVSFEAYQTTKDWTLTPDNGTKIVYVKFRSSDGGTIIYSATIELTGQSFFDPNSLVQDVNPNNCSLIPQHAYKSNKNNAVYYITTNCTKRAFTSSKIFFTYFNNWSEVIVTTKLNTIANDTLGFMPYGPKYNPKSGALVKTTNDPRVYLLLNNSKYWITDENIFNALNYQWNWIEDVDQRLLDKYTAKEEITTTNTHPNYTLIKYNNDSKVYRLEPDPTDLTKQVKRYVSNETEFDNLNFRVDRIVTINESKIYRDIE
ncbi:MAG: fibronectin type III domain-containing protein, partial [Candidatus Magasanikbacteria bacterium]